MLSEIIKDKSVGVMPIQKTDNGFLFLIIQHAEGHWGFPKGHPDPGETETETSLRELREETEITECRLIDDFKYVQNYSFEKDGAQVIKEVVFSIGLVESTEVQIDRDEIIDFRWLPYKQALEQLSFDENHTMLKVAFEFLSKKVKRN